MSMLVVFQKHAHRWRWLCLCCEKECSSSSTSSIWIGNHVVPSRQGWQISWRIQWRGKDLLISLPGWKYEMHSLIGSLQWRFLPCRKQRRPSTIQRSICSILWLFKSVLIVTTFNGNGFKSTWLNRSSTVSVFRLHRKTRTVRKTWIRRWQHLWNVWKWKHRNRRGILHVFFLVIWQNKKIQVCDFLRFSLSLLIIEKSRMLTRLYVHVTLSMITL